MATPYSWRAAFCRFGMTHFVDSGTHFVEVVTHLVDSGTHFVDMEQQNRGKWKCAGDNQSGKTEGGCTASLVLRSISDIAVLTGFLKNETSTSTAAIPKE